MDESPIIRLKTEDKVKIWAKTKLVINHFKWIIETLIPLNPKFHIYNKKSLEWWIGFCEGYNKWVEDNDFITKKQNVKLEEALGVMRKTVTKIVNNKKINIPDTISPDSGFLPNLKDR